jgi:tryprostatin B 6-hydroxylase
MSLFTGLNVQEPILIPRSDTTATTLTHVFYSLVKNPAHVHRLREEIQPTIAADGKISHQKLQRLDHLNGVIYETLRLYPPVGTALQRLTPGEGLQIGSTFIPPKTTVWCPQYVIGRSKYYRSQPESFTPLLRLP